MVMMISWNWNTFRNLQLLNTESLYIVLCELYCKKECFYIGRDMSTTQVIRVFYKIMD